MSEAARNDLEKGVAIGDFRIERRLGAGGMGIVYQARQVSLNRKVALKVLGSALNRPADILRFQREAQAIARLHHPGIASVYFIGQDSQICYLALEFIEGTSLRKVIERLREARDPELNLDNAVGELVGGEEIAPTLRMDDSTLEFVVASNGLSEADPYDIPPELLGFIGSNPHQRRCCEIVREVALALAHAHESGVIHRDIKPENVLIDQNGLAHVVDFGLARFYEDVTVTCTGQLVGTPMYMSPEQVSGRINVDHRADIYALGLVLYELLTLCRPMGATTREALLRHIVTKPLIPVSWRNPGVTSALENVVHKATAKDPDARYLAAAEFAADLQQVLDGKPVTARPYRYAIDEREIVAARPKPIVTMAFAIFLSGIFFAVSGVAGIIDVAIGIGGATQDNAARWELAAAIAALALGAASLFVGFVLLSARGWARIAGFVVAFGVGCLVVALLGIQFWSIKLTQAAPTLFILMVFEVLCAAAGFASGFVLNGRPARDWFHLARTVRREGIGRRRQ